MRIVGGGETCAEGKERHRGVVEGELLLQLVEGALEERGGGGHDGSATGLGDARGKSHGMFLGDAGIHIMRAGALTEVLRDAVGTGRGGRDDHQPRFGGETAFQRRHGKTAVVFAGAKRGICP